MYVRAGRPAFARPCVGIHKSTSLISSSLLLQQCSACLVRLTWIVFVIGGRWPYSWCLVGCWIFPHDLRLNTNMYINSWGRLCYLDQVSGCYIWQHDITPCHTSRSSQWLLEESFCDHITPNICWFYFSACYLLDFLWVRRNCGRVQSTLHNRKSELKARITAALKYLNKETIANVCRGFWSGLGAVAEANDDFFE